MERNELEEIMHAEGEVKCELEEIMDVEGEVKWELEEIMDVEGEVPGPSSIQGNDSSADSPPSFKGVILHNDDASKSFVSVPIDIHNYAKSPIAFDLYSRLDTRYSCSSITGITGEAGSSQSPDIDNAPVFAEHANSSDVCTMHSDVARTVEDPVHVSYTLCTIEDCRTIYTEPHNLGAHTTWDRERFKCLWLDCDSSYRGLRPMVVHLRCHSGAVVYRCGVRGCDRIFTEPHLRRIHRDLHTERRPYVCYKCNKNFGSVYALERHESTHDFD